MELLNEGFHIVFFQNSVNFCSQTAEKWPIGGQYLLTLHAWAFHTTVCDTPRSCVLVLLQRLRIAGNAWRCKSHGRSVRLSARPSRCGVLSRRMRIAKVYMDIHRGLPKRGC